MQITIGGGSSSLSEFWTAFGPTSAIVVALAGWLVAEKFARSRERRSDLRTLIGVLDNSIERIVEQASEFYSLDGNDARAKVVAKSIKTKLASLASHLNTIRGMGLELETDTEMKAFRQCVTGGAFEDISRPRIAQDSIKIQTINMTAEDLRLKVSTEFFRQMLKV